MACSVDCVGVSVRCARVNGRQNPHIKRENMPGLIFNNCFVKTNTTKTMKLNTKTKT